MIVIAFSRGPTPTLTPEPTFVGHDARGRGWPMQLWVALLVFAVTVPLGALLLWNAREEARADEEAAGLQVEQLARQMAAETDRFLEDTRLVLERTADRPAIRAMDRGNCDPLFADFREQFPRYANLLLIDRNASGICSSVRMVEGTGAYAEFPYFKALASGAPYHITAPWIGRSTKRWIAAMAVPILDETGTFVGALAIAIDLQRFPLTLLDAGALPQGAALELVARDGRYIAGAGAHAEIGSEAPRELRTVVGRKSRRAVLHADHGQVVGHLDLPAGDIGIFRARDLTDETGSRRVGDLDYGDPRFPEAGGIEKPAVVRDLKGELEARDAVEVVVGDEFEVLGGEPGHQNSSR